MAGNSLADRIADLAAETPEFKEGARVLSVKGGALEAVLDEIDATVLSAGLLFEHDSASLQLTVSSRRLVAVAGAEGLSDVPEGLVGSALSMDAMDQVNAAAKLIEAFANGASSLRVTASRAEEADVGDSVSVSALRSAMGLVVDDPDASPIERFLARVDDKLEALLLLNDGSVSKTQGSIQLVQSLKISLSTQLQTFLDTRNATCPSHTDPSLTLCEHTISDSKGMAIAVHGNDIALFAFESDAVSDLCAAWRRVA